MIQRVQTIFWLLGLIASASLFWLPFAGIDTTEHVYRISLDGVKSDAGEYLVNSWPVLVLGILIVIIQFLVIFQYKRRVLQMRMTMYNILLLAGWLIVGFLYARVAARMLEGTLQPAYVSIMPVVAIILNLLAWRGVRRDYLMLKAVDRIR